MNKSKFEQVLKTLTESSCIPVYKTNNCTYLNGDCRKQLTHMPHEHVNCVITSPPYGNLKNYGTIGEIGHGQNIQEKYLPELENILKELHRVSVKGGALWLILDMFRYRGKTVALPFELMERARKVGWQFQDMIVWDKGRNLPWSHKGRFRSVSEHILLFSKGNSLSHFNIDELRSTQALSTYWVKYPERFHPDGKAPTDIWHIPIPTQGSWSRDNKAPHFCPFPIELVNRMIALTTQKGDLVLDPFCGTGSVLVAASSLDRYALGFDINRNFFNSYKTHGGNALELEANQLKQQVQRPSDLRKTIIRLRANKYAASLFREISKRETDGDTIASKVVAIIIKSFSILPKRRENTVAQVELLVVTNEPQTSHLNDEIQRIKSYPPLSKFGLDTEISITSSCEAIRHLNKILATPYARKTLYLYRNLCFNMFSSRVKIEELVQNSEKYFGHKQRNTPDIWSPIQIQISPTK